MTPKFPWTINTPETNLDVLASLRDVIGDAAHDGTDLAEMLERFADACYVMKAITESHTNDKLRRLAAAHFRDICSAIANIKF